MAVAQFEIGFELRPRTEYRHGYRFLADSAQRHAIFTDQRTRLNLNYQTEKYQLFFTLQDVRTWGSQSQLVVSDGLTSVHQAWGKVYFNDHWSVKLGRQEIIYDDHRIFGNVGWAQQGRSHDAAIIGFQKNNVKLDLGFAYNQNQPNLVGTSYTVNGSYKAFQYIHLYFKPSENIIPSFLILSKGDQVDYVDDNGQEQYHDNYSVTTGTNTKWKTNNKLKGSVNVYYQFGSTAQKPARDINAFLIGAEVGYPFFADFSGVLGFEIQSGNDVQDFSDQQNAFTPFFGTNHKFNGHMDYFYVGNYIGSFGLLDGFLKLKHKTSKFVVGGDVHYFQTQGDVGEFDKYLGIEVDLNTKVNLTSNTSMGLGYSQFFGSETLAILHGVTSFNGEPYNEATNNWAYFMLSFNPTLKIKTDKQ